jgi:hypothetical protein
MSETGISKMKGHSFAMERMMAKDEEERLDRVNTKQRTGTPTVTNFFICKFKNNFFYGAHFWSSPGSSGSRLM